MFAIKNSCFHFVRCVPTAGGLFAKFRYRCPDDFYFFRQKCMPISHMRSLGITCPYNSGPNHDDRHYLPQQVGNKTDFPLKKPEYEIEIIDMERQDFDNYDLTFSPTPK
ncbi:unnamed protein product [Orchesella dallaii]|uniref:Chitin-binding type-2 domain-containing protein n=1 Tax=Orchesella dallaii TaxID=48710 RepID=A0ABP1R9Q6_9HEXA